MAGPYYVRSTDGNDADSGLTWALAKATLAGALAVAAAGERIWVSQAHAETQASAMTLTSPGTGAAPVEILCGNDAAEPPTALATAATVSTTGASALSCLGHAYVYGISFSAGSGASLAAFNFTSTASWRWAMESCVLILGNSNNSSRIVVGSSSTVAVDGALDLMSSSVQFGSAVQAFTIGVPLRWTGGGLILGTAPTGGLIKAAVGLTPLADLLGVDLSNLGANAVVGIGTGALGGRIRIMQCKLAASATLTTGTNPGPGQTSVWLDNTDSSDTQSRMQRHSYEGDVYSETTNIRTGGASNGTTALSHKYVSSANRKFTTPLYGPDYVIWNAATGSSQTITVEIAQDAAATALTDAECWLEVEYLGTSGVPLSLFASDRAASILATPANQDTSTVTWAGLTSPTKQKLVVTCTPQEIGILRCRVALAKASATVYVDPLVTVA